MPHRDNSDEQAAVHIRALGVPVVVRVSGRHSTELVQALESAWEWCLAGSPTEHSVTDTLVIEAFLDKDNENVRRMHGRGFLASTSLDELMHWLTPMITTQAITARANSLLMMHACVLADPSSGAAVVLAGPSGAGKTTLARTLGTSFGYVTDECAGIRDDHTVVPFPKPLSLVTGASSGVKDQASPSSLGLAEPPASPRVVAVLYLDRRDDAPEAPSLTAVPNVHALGLLCPQVSFVGSRPAPLQRIVSLLDAAGGLRRVTYRDAADLLSVVGRLMEGVPGLGDTAVPPTEPTGSAGTALEAAQHLSGLDGTVVPPQPAVTPTDGPAGVRVRRMPYLDEYVEAGESAVLVGDRVFVLSELATTILDATREEVDVMQVAGVLEDVFGPPPAGTGLIEATVGAAGALAGAGLVQCFPLSREVR